MRIVATFDNTYEVDFPVLYGLTPEFKRHTIAMCSYARDDIYDACRFYLHRNAHWVQFDLYLEKGDCLNQKYAAIDAIQDILLYDIDGKLTVYQPKNIWK